jgi:plasmid stabilization system protein ParE
MIIIKYSELAEETFEQEIDFIISKWNLLESKKFAILVNDCLDTLSKSPEIGRYNTFDNHYSFVISKQTTLFYKYNETLLSIELILFWNNSQNPNLLSKLLK